MPKDVDKNTSTEAGSGNGRWRGNVEADIDNIGKLIETSSESIGKLFDEVYDMAQRVTVVETKATAMDTTMPNLALKDDVAESIKNHAIHENRNNVLSGGGGGVIGCGGGIAVWEAIRALFF